mgnify:CR=1 FL=1
MWVDVGVAGGAVIFAVAGDAGVEVAPCFLCVGDAGDLSEPAWGVKANTWCGGRRAGASAQAQVAILAEGGGVMARGAAPGVVAGLQWVDDDVTGAVDLFGAQGAVVAVEALLVFVAALAAFEIGAGQRAVSAQDVDFVVWRRDQASILRFEVVGGIGLGVGVFDGSGGLAEAARQDAAGGLPGQRRGVGVGGAEVGLGVGDQQHGQPQAAQRQPAAPFNQRV